jgi:hypothetical protein
MRCPGRELLTKIEGQLYPINVGEVHGLSGVGPDRSVQGFPEPARGASPRPGVDANALSTSARQVGDVERNPRHRTVDGTGSQLIVRTVLRRGGRAWVLRIAILQRGSSTRLGEIPACDRRILALLTGWRTAFLCRVYRLAAVDFSADSAVFDFAASCRPRAEQRGLWGRYWERCP